MALAGIIGGLIGDSEGSGDRQKAKRLQQDALNEIMGLKLPTIEELQIQMEELRSQGQLTPEMEEAFNQQASELAQISGDPRLKDAQMSALTKMQQIGQDGLGAQDRLRINDVRRNVAQDQQAADAAIMQSMNARGAGGSGVELAQRLISGQGQANRASMQGDQIAAQANQQALDAIMKSGQLGGDIRTQDFSEEARKAEAQDVINRFNTANRQNVSSNNVGLRNRAQEVNLGEKQRIADSNTNTRNSQQKYNKEVISGDYQRRADKADAASRALNQQAGNYQKSGDATAAKYAKMGESMDEAAYKVGGAMMGGMSDEKAKKKIKPAGQKLYDFLDNISANSYEYKDEKHGEGEKISPMAQELEKTDAGKGMVEDTPEGKMVDYGAGFGTMLASQAELHERLKKLEGKK